MLSILSIRSVSGVFSQHRSYGTQTLVPAVLLAGWAVALLAPPAKAARGFVTGGGAATFFGAGIRAAVVLAGAVVRGAAAARVGAADLGGTGGLRVVRVLEDVAPLLLLSALVRRVDTPIVDRVTSSSSVVFLPKLLRVAGREIVDADFDREFEATRLAGGAAEETGVFRFPLETVVAVPNGAARGTWVVGRGIPLDAALFVGVANRGRRVFTGGYSQRMLLMSLSLDSLALLTW